MKKIKGLQTILSVLILTAILFAVSSCIGDSGVSKKRGIVKDFSTSKNGNGCGLKDLVYVTPYDTCVSDCSSTTGTHIASLNELAAVKTELVSGKASTGAISNADVLTRVNASANICVPDVVVETRPTNAIDIKSDFCSCLNGKSDVINDCDNFCATKASSNQPILYVNTIIGTDIALNTKLGNLYNWCKVQLTSDDTAPQCVVRATDGANTVDLTLNLTAGSNSFSVNVLPLAIDRAWILKLVESKTGSNAQSKEFQIRRKAPASTDTNVLGALKVTPISQYTCMTYGGKVDKVGKIIRTTFARIFYYFSSNETPPPIPSAGGTNDSLVVCHDEQLHPGADSAVYDRLELIPNAMAMWDKADTRFVTKAINGNKMTINKILEDRLSAEYNITGSTISLFTLISYPNRPTSTSTSTAVVPLGFMMVPFTNPDTGKSYCPTATEFNGNQPLMNLLGEYMDSTEGLFLGEKEVETVLDGSSYKQLYGTMFVRESTLLSYGFYIENGLKTKASAASMNTKTIYYYWPTSPTADPLTQGNRKLFTVRTYDTLNGNVPTGQQTTERTTDKRIGCIPKS
ncbi:MAG: hypothetical protein H7336_03035 [Bacteriovorax sp.]|nr:hypothetical protein [Bacteriovorax sp.]